MSVQGEQACEVVWSGTATKEHVRACRLVSAHNRKPLHSLRVKSYKETTKPSCLSSMRVLAMLSSHRSSFGQVYVHGETLYMRMVSTFFFLNGWQKICWVFIRRKRNSTNKTKYNRKQLRSWKQHRQLSATKNTNTGNKNNCNSKEKQNYDFVASWYCWKSSLIRKATSSQDLYAWLKVFRYRWWCRLWRGKG